MASVLRLRFLGEPRIERDGAALPLPQSKKTRALLAYLAVTGRSHRRERLCSLLWELPDDPRGALRWSLSRLRPLVDEPAAPRIIADRETVRFDLNGASIDILDLRRAIAGNLDAMSTEDLTALDESASGEFLEGLDLSQHHDFHAWCIAEREEVRALRIRILSLLVDRLKSQPKAALPYGRALVGLQSHEELAWARFVRLLAAAGRRREAEQQCELGMRMLEDAGMPATGPLQKVWRNLRKTQVAEPAAPRSDQSPTTSAATHLVLQARWPSVTVLPLRPVGDSPALVHLADAIGDDLVTSLSRDRNMTVIPHMGGTHTDLRLIAQQTGAQYLVEGSVRGLDRQLIVSIRLVDALEAKHIWAERSVLSLDTDLTMDDQFARKIAAILRVEIEATEAARAQNSVSASLDVRAHYHLGLRELYRFTRTGLLAAQAHFERAAELDPDFAALHARLSYVHIQRYWYGSPTARVSALDAALEAAKRAVALDPKDALGHFALGRVYAIRRQFDFAMPELEAAVRLDPTLAQGFFGLGQACWYAGRPKEAIRLLDCAIELNPHDPHAWSFHHDQSEAYFALGLLAEAERGTRAAASLPNSTHWPWVTLASVLGIAHKKEDGAEALRELKTRRPDYNLTVAEDEFSHFSDRAFANQYLEGLRKAGLQ